MNKDYVPIPGLGTGRGSFQAGMRHRLYQGVDHLLVVQSTGYTEDYRRVFYRDILCVVVRKSPRQIWIGAAMAIIIILLLLFRSVNLPWYLIGIFSLPFAVIFVINLIRGPSCECYVTTRVQTVAVPTPARMNKISQFLEFLQTKVPTLPVDPTAS